MSTITCVHSIFLFFFSSRRRHTRFDCDWSSDVCSSDLRRNVPVDRRFLEIRYHPPERWSVVRCEPREIQRVGRLFPLTYAVCPACRHRQAFESDVKELMCERCKKAGALAWDEMS